ncbi:MAG: hypothetical protein AAGG46_13155, partial [Planctomycetota bacterium]
GLVDDSADYLFVANADGAGVEQLYNDGCDDYRVILGADPPEQARLIEYLRYRIVLQLVRDGIVETARDAIADDNNNSFDIAERIEAVDGNGVPLASPLLRARVEQIVNQVIHGDNSVVNTATRADFYSFGGLLAPEVLAGMKMDLNRPFGDGRDNGDGLDSDGNGLIDDAAELGIDPFMNGVVDEPQEAGEPWVDLNNDGTADVGEYLDFDLDGQYDEPLDELWDDVLGDAVPFDHVNGQDVNGLGGVTATGLVIRDDAQLARQLYARHLYCLTLLLMDENYLAPIDPRDSQARHYVNPRSGSLWDYDGNAATPPILRVGSSPAYKIAYELIGSDPAAVP